MWSIDSEDKRENIERGRTRHGCCQDGPTTIYSLAWLFLKTFSLSRGQRCIAITTSWLEPQGVKGNNEAATSSTSKPRHCDLVLHTLIDLSSGIPVHQTCQVTATTILSSQNLSIKTMV